MKVLIADDHRLVLDGIRRALEEAEDMEVVGEAMNGAQVLPLVRRTNPDVVLLDMRMPQMDGLACLDQLRKHAPGVTVIMLRALRFARARYQHQQASLTYRTDDDDGSASTWRPSSQLPRLDPAVAAWNLATDGVAVQRRKGVVPE